MAAGTAPAAQSSGLGISAHDLGIGFAVISLISRESRVMLTHVVYWEHAPNHLSPGLTYDVSAMYPGILPIVLYPSHPVHQHNPFIVNLDLQSTKSRQPPCSHP